MQYQFRQNVEMSGWYEKLSEEVQARIEFGQDVPGGKYDERLNDNRQRTQNSTRSNIPKAPRFGDGSKWKSFRGLFKDWIVAYHGNETEEFKLQQLRMSLDGTPRDYLENEVQRPGRTEPMTCKLAYQFLEDRFFVKISPEVAQGELFALSQDADEDILRWHDRIAEKLGEAYPTIQPDGTMFESLLRSHFLRGMYDRKAKEHLLLHSKDGATTAENINEFRKFNGVRQAVGSVERTSYTASHLENNISTPAQTPSEATVRQVNPTQDSDILAKVSEQLAALSREVGNLREEVKSMKSNSGTNKALTIRQHDTGTSSPSTIEQRATNRYSQRPFKCWFCGEEGHKKMECPRWKSVNSQQREKLRQVHANNWRSQKEMMRNVRAVLVPDAEYQSDEETDFEDLRDLQNHIQDFLNGSA